MRLGQTIGSISAVLFSSCALAQDVEIVGRVMRITAGVADGQVIRISDTNPDGQIMSGGDLLYSGDRLTLSGVEVTVEVCDNQATHDYRTGFFHLSMPLNCNPVQLEAVPNFGSPGAGVALTDPSGVDSHTRTASVPPDTNRPVTTAAATEGTADAGPNVVSGGNSPDLRWPLEGMMSSEFARTASGISISVLQSAEVVAAASGDVIFSGPLANQGNVVLVSHPDGFVTVYANLSSSTVDRGQAVASGDVIGTIGAGSDDSDSQLRFELRANAAPVDPLPYFLELP